MSDESTENKPEKPKRRVRYSGRNPRKASEKYKELNPEKYADDMEKVKSRGATPLGTHRPICVDEILEILNPQPGELALDATLGYGGHASFILPRLQPNGRLIGLDQDPIERPKTEKRLKGLGFADSTLLIGAINFSQTKNFLIENNIPKVDMILADLGVSSMQIDDPNRGFSYKNNAPLDLRMNPECGITAAEAITKLTASELSQILRENSDEMRSDVIAKALVLAKPKTTFEMTEVLQKTISGFSKKVQEEQGDLPIRRTFQALRIYINQEFIALDQFLNDLPSLLKPNGRVAILTFHSGEDRRVKKSFQHFHRNHIYKSIADEFIRPSFEEQRNNTRSKSAKLRWAKI